MNSPGISYSAISAAYTCFQKYKYLYIDKLKELGPESANLHFGTALHMGLQAILEGDDPLPAFSLYMQSLNGKEIDWGRYGLEEYSKMGDVFLARFSRLHAKHFTNTITMESRLYGNLGDVKLEGTPDWVGSYKGVPSLVDFKTSGYTYPKEKIVVNEQMPLYAHLVEQNFGVKVEQLVYYVFVKADQRIQVQTHPLTKEFMKAKLDNIKLMCDDLSTRRVFPKNTNGCMMGQYRCGFYEVCYGKSE